jgi:mutator protein MutT
VSAEPPRVVVTAAVIEQDERFLVTRRQPGVPLAGLWEFPGGKCDDCESHARCLQREIAEELGASVRVQEEIFTTSHTYPDRTVELHFYRCALEGTPRPLVGQEMRWIHRDDLAALEFPPADTGLIEVLTSRQA